MQVSRIRDPSYLVMVSPIFISHLLHDTLTGWYSRHDLEYLRHFFSVTSQFFSVAYGHTLTFPSSWSSLSLDHLKVASEMDNHLFVMCLDLLCLSHAPLHLYLFGLPLIWFKIIRTVKKKLLNVSPLSALSLKKIFWNQMTQFLCKDDISCGPKKLLSNVVHLVAVFHVFVHVWTFLIIQVCS